MMWFGCVQDGSLFVKPYKGQEEMDEAIDNFLVMKVYEPFEALNKEHAIQRIKENK